MEWNGWDRTRAACVYVCCFLGSDLREEKEDWIGLDDKARKLEEGKWTRVRGRDWRW